MLTSMLLAATLVVQVEFDVQTLDGRTVTGRVVALDSERLTVETADGAKSFAVAELANVVRVESLSAKPPRPAAWVELIDGSLLPVADYLVEGDKATLVAAQNSTVPTAKTTPRAVRWVRFLQPDAADEKLDRQWTTIVDARPTSDILVARKQGALDEVEGALQNIDAETVQFEVDKEVLPVRRAKVEGLVYVHPANRELPEPVGIATTSDGTRLAMRTASFEAGALVVKSPVGLSLAIGLDKITRLDYSTGKVAFLSDLEPQAASYTPLVGGKEELAAVTEFYRYRRDQGLDGKPLATGGKSFRKGLALASRTALAYRLPGKFRVFKATVGIDDGVRPLGIVRLSVQGDGKVLWQGDVRGSEPAQELEVEIGGVKRLEIVADFGDDLDIGDRLDLCEARVSK